MSAVAIVGAGPGGIAAAIIVARDGHDVTVYERANRVGGRCATMVEQGFTFDTGPTFFFLPDELRALVAECGGDLDAMIALTPLDPLYTVIFASGRRLALCADPAAMQASLTGFDAQDADSFVRFQETAKRNYAALAPSLDHGFDDWRQVVAAGLRVLPRMRPWRSLGREVRRHFRNPDIRDLFSFQSAYIGMLPESCPSLFSFVPFIEAQHGLVHPTGGCGAVMTALADFARGLGVTFRLGKAVDRIMVEGGRATGVVVGDQPHRAEAVIVNADFAHAMSTLLADTQRRRWTNAQLARRRFSCSTYMLYLGLEGAVELPHHTIVLADQLNREWDAIEGAERQADSRGFYVQNACVTDSDLAPAGHSTPYVIVTVPNLDTGVQPDLPALRRSVLHRLETLGVSDVERRIRVEKACTPRDWQAAGIHHGAVFNLSHSLRQLGYFRPHGRSEDVRSLYVVGGGTHPGSGLPLIFNSTRIACGSIQADLSRQRRRRRAA